jgi:adenylate kinase
VFHSLFKAAWHQQPQELPVFGMGTNPLPCIHVADLAATLLNVIESRPATKYIVAIDDSRSTLFEVTQAIAEHLGTGNVKHVSAEEGLAGSMLTQQQQDLLSLDLRIDANCVKEFVINWKGQNGLIAAIQPVIAEFKTARNLTPLKVCVLGPTGTNKSAYAARLCAKYKLHHVRKDFVIDEAVARLEASAAILLDGNVEDLDGDVQAQSEQDRELLDQLKAQLVESGGEHEAEQVTTWFRAKLRSMACLNQGFVLDGYPTTLEQATALFAAADDAEDADAPDALTVPEFVFSLDGSDAFLERWVMELPQPYAEAHGLTEDVFTKSLAEFRARNAVENAVINYFDFQEIHPVDVDVEALDGFLIVPTTAPIDFGYLDNGEVMKRMVAVIGEPHNYGPTSAEKATIDAKADKAATAAAEVEAMLTAMKDAEEEAAHVQEQTKWDASLKLVKDEEKQALEASASPLRTFLIRHVMPTLTDGLVEVSKARPDDPVDFLAEFLFRHNPTPLLN